MTSEPNKSSDFPEETRRELTPEQGIHLWIDLMETCDQLLQAGLQASLGPNENFADVYREWHAQKTQEHGEMILNMARRFQERLGEDAPATHS